MGPDPKNIEPFRGNLRDFEDRYELGEAAVALENGTARFGTEPIGRYGTLELDIPTGHPAHDVIEVETKALDDILDDVIDRHGRIDVLKVDVEGSEEKLVGSIRTEHLERIATIYYETDDPVPLHLDRFSHHFSSQTNRLRRIAS